MLLRAARLDDVHRRFELSARVHLNLATALHRCGGGPSPAGRDAASSSRDAEALHHVRIAQSLLQRCLGGALGDSTATDAATAPRASVPDLLALCAMASDAEAQLHAAMGDVDAAEAASEEAAVLAAQAADDELSARLLVQQAHLEEQKQRLEEAEERQRRQDEERRREHRRKLLASTGGGDAGPAAALLDPSEIAKAERLRPQSAAAATGAAGAAGAAGWGRPTSPRLAQAGVDERSFDGSQWDRWCDRPGSPFGMLGQAGRPRPQSARAATGPARPSASAGAWKATIERLRRPTATSQRTTRGEACNMEAANAFIHVSATCATCARGP